MKIPSDFLDDCSFAQTFERRETVVATHEFSSSRFAGAFSSDQLDLKRLREFSANGNLVEIIVRSGDDFEARFAADSSRLFALTSTTGSVDDVTTNRDLSMASIESADPYELAQSIVTPELSVALTLRAPEGFPFVWSSDWFGSLSSNWSRTMGLLAKCERVLVMDAGDAWIASPSLLIYGPDYEGSPNDKPTAILTHGADLATTDHYAPVEGKGLAEAIGCLRKLACAVTWLRVARFAEVGSGELKIAFDEETHKSIGLPWTALADTPAEIHDCVRLSNWLNDDDDGVRLEAARRAASAIVRSPAELLDAAGPTLRQARFLDEQSRRTAISAVVDARRTAWTSAHQAAHSAAGEARSSARTSADRSVAAVIASLAVIITHQSSVVSFTVSFVVLAAVAVGLVATWLQAEMFEFPSTESALTAELEELRTAGRHVLLSEDIDEIEQGPVVTDAQATIGSARTTSRVALALAVVAIVVGFVAVNAIVPSPSNDTTVVTTVP